MVRCDFDGSSSLVTGCDYGSYRVVFMVLVAMRLRCLFRLRVYGLLFVVLGGLVCGLFSFRLLFVNFCCWVWFAGLLRLFSCLCCGWWLIVICGYEDLFWGVLLWF